METDEIASFFGSSLVTRSLQAVLGMHKLIHSLQRHSNGGAAALQLLPPSHVRRFHAFKAAHALCVLMPFHVRIERNPPLENYALHAHHPVLRTKN